MEELRKFVSPEFVFGSGALSLAGRYAEHMGADRIFLVTDEGVRRSGWAGRVLESLSERGIRTECFDAVLPNPRDTQVMEGVDLYRRHRCDVILAVGGGSVIDAAKGIGIVATNGGHILDYEGVDRIPHPMPPLICIPTTSGSSADVSQFAIITDTVRRIKIAIISKAVVPDIALIDPDTLKSMDRTLASAVCLDTLTHAVEAYVSQAHSFMTDRHALGAVELIGTSLLPALNGWGGRAPLAPLMQASLEAGLAFSNASLGLVHAMAHALGGRKDFPHGECNGLLLKNVCAFNYESCPERFDRIAAALAARRDGRIRSGLEGLCDELDRLIAGTGIRNELDRFHLTREDCRNLAENAMNDACIVTNPREPGTEEIAALYEQTFG